MENEKKICAAYIRVSTHDQEEYSPESQIKILQDYAKQHNMILPDEYIFRDDGISGRNVKRRTGFNTMIATAKIDPKPFDVLLLWKFARFARNQEESIVYKSILRKKRGIEVISVTEPIMKGPLGSLVERFIEWQDEYYSINLGTEVRRGMTERASRGLPVSTAPLGYRYQDKNLVIVPEEADIVRMIYREFLSGSSIIGIAKKLNTLKILTKRGNIWENRTVRYILSNPVYIGKIRWCPDGTNDYHQDIWNDSTMLIDGIHEPILSAETFAQAQDRLEEHSKKYKGNRKVAQREEVSWALQGLVKCGSCGGTMTRTSTGINCSKYVHGQCSISHYIGQEALEKMVRLAIRQQLGDLEIEITKQDRPARDEEQRQLQQRIKREQETLRRHKEAYAAGVDTLQEYKGNKAGCQERINALQNQLDKLSQQKPVSKEKFCENAIGILDQIEDERLTPQEKNSLYRSFIDHITFYKNPNTVEIVYWA